MKNDQEYDNHELKDTVNAWGQSIFRYFSIGQNVEIDFWAPSCLLTTKALHFGKAEEYLDV